MSAFSYVNEMMVFKNKQGGFLKIKYDHDKKAPGKEAFYGNRLGSRLLLVG